MHTKIFPKKFLLIGLCTLLVIAGLVAVKAGWLPQELPTYFQEEDDNAAIAVTGNIEVREVDVGFTVSGRLKQVFAEEGQAVEQDEQLATLEQTEFKDRVAKNRAVLREAQAHLEDLQSGARQQEIDSAKAKLAAVEAELTKAREDFDRARALYEDGFLSEARLDAAWTAYEATLARQQQAQEQLDLLQTGPTEETLAAGPGAGETGARRLASG
jgi:HlyD family secretion protein